MTIGCSFAFSCFIKTFIITLVFFWKNKDSFIRFFSFCEIIRNFDFIYWKILIWLKSDLEVDCKMRYLTLTSDSSKYRCVSVGDTIVLSWTVHHDFTNISDIGISSIRFTGFAKSQKQRGHDIMVPINSNLITRTVMNPKRNILSLKIPRNNAVAECQLNMSRCLLFTYS